MPDETTYDAMTDRLAALSAANMAFAEARPGSRPDRQPVHTVYGGAQLFKSDTAPKMGAIARRHLLQYAPDFIVFMRAFGLRGADRVERRAHATELLDLAANGSLAALKDKDKDAWLAATVFQRVLHKIESEPIEDFRIDFEDGFGVRTSEVEDREAQRAAGETVAGLREGTLPPYIGIRIKPLNEEYRDRSLRTLRLYLEALLSRSDGRLPPLFVVTLPKITVPEQVAVLAVALDEIEQRYGLKPGSIGIEVMIETPASIFDRRGRPAIPALVDAAEGRCTGAHFGVYDYTALLEITANYQQMGHGACDFARHVMQVALAGTGVWISDGATNVMPVAPHRPAEGGRLTSEQERENIESVHGAWRLAYNDIMHSLRSGFYQGWDLHPAQLAARYAAVYTFFLEGFDAAAERLRSFVDKAAQATLVGNIFDDAATGQGLLNYFLRAVNSGAISMDEAAQTGLTMDELRSRSFSHIVKERTRKLTEP